jgi:hypothetical protein
MSRVIVTTTINPPTEALRKFGAMPDWDLVVIGDKKTPTDFHIEGATYVTPEEQEKYDPALSEALGWNCVERRNYGFLWARDMGAEVVAVVDDDNIPLENWGQNIWVGEEVEVDWYETDLPAFDPIAVTEHNHMWHRGYPPQLLAQRDFGQPTRKTITPDVQADFWNGDPDIDAFCRMQFMPDITFDPSTFPIASNKVGPFNSQNTFVSPDWLGEYFLFPFVGRFIDIWTAYYVQAHGAKLLYGPPTVYQDRNEHDLTVDLAAEFVGYEHTLRLLARLEEDPMAIFEFMPERSGVAYRAYRKHFE